MLDRTAFCCALVAWVGASMWMCFTAAFDYGGNWTAFYRTGSHARLPPIAEQEHIFVSDASGGGGYDGQYYRLIAQDPFLLHGTGDYIDSPRLRDRRILVPALAWLVALGNPERATYTFIPVVLFFLGLGTYWLSRYAMAIGLSPWWGFAFLFSPAAFLSLDRLCVDIALAALTIGFALYWKDEPVKLYIVLVLAALAKETGILLIAGYCLSMLLQRQWRKMMVMATAGVPAALWFVYVQRHTPDDGTAWIQLPFSAVLEGMLHPALYPGRQWYVTPFDYLAWIGMLLAIVLAMARWRKNDPVSRAALLFALLAVVIDFNVWQEVEGFGRAFTPLLLLLPLASPSRWAVLPMLLLLPRGMAFPFAETLAAFGLGIK
jgi:hypothetical protein